MLVYFYALIRGPSIKLITVGRFVNQRTACELIFVWQNNLASPKQYRAFLRDSYPLWIGVFHEFPPWYVSSSRAQLQLFFSDGKLLQSSVEFCSARKQVRISSPP